MSNMKPIEAYVFIFRKAVSAISGVRNLTNILPGISLISECRIDESLIGEIPVMRPLLD
jgi:hypothetical protein